MNENSFRTYAWADAEASLCLVAHSSSFPATDKLDSMTWCRVVSSKRLSQDSLSRSCVFMMSRSFAFNSFVFSCILERVSHVEHYLTPRLPNAKKKKKRVQRLENKASIAKRDSWTNLWRISIASKYGISWSCPVTDKKRVREKSVETQILYRKKRKAVRHLENI